MPGSLAGFCYPHAIHPEGWRSPLIYFTVEFLLIIQPFFHTLSCKEQQKKRDGKIQKLEAFETARMISRSVSLDELQLCIEAKTDSQCHCIDSSGPETRQCQKVRSSINIIFFIFCQKLLEYKITRKHNSRSVSVQNTSESILKRKSVPIFQAV